MEKRYKVGLIGCGRVGLSFIRLLKGVSIIGIYDRSARKVKIAKKILNKQRLTPGKIAKVADIILIATNDDQIGVVARSLRQKGFKKVLIHFSGILSSEILGRTNRASIHPLGSFSDLKIAWERMKKIPFIIEGDLNGLRIAKKIIRSFGGRYHVINPKDKPYYHLACVFGSNLLVGLYSMVERIIKKKNLKINMIPLLDSTIENLKSCGIKNGITGPFVRGDVETIRTHVKILKKMGVDYRIIYYILNREILNFSLPDNKDLLYSELATLFKQQKIDP